MYSFILFICGMSVMILELAGVRVISPFLGNSHVIYTSIIGVVMAALSFGYYIGGKLSKYNPDCRKLSIILLFSGIYLFLLSIFQFKLLKIICTINTNMIILAVISAIVIFAIPSILLGIISPYIVQIALNNNKNKENEGSIVGKLYAISTIGSIIGTFLCGFYLILVFGIDTIFFYLSALLFICAIVCFLIDLKDKKKRFNAILIAEIIMFIISVLCLVYFKLNPIQIFDGSIYSKTTPYDYISLVEYSDKETGKKYIRLHNKFSSAYKDSEPNDFYAEYIRTTYNIFVNKINNKNVLILGNASGSLLSGMLYYLDENNISGVHIDAIELDKYYTEIGEKFFKLPKNDSRVCYYYEDARTFINRNANKEKKYDLILFDIYSTWTPTFPFYLVTSEAIENMKSMLNDDGVLMINSIGSDKSNMIYYDYLCQVYTQLKSSFQNIKIYKTDTFLLVAFNGEDNENTKYIQDLLKEFEFNDIKETSQVYTDKFSPIEKYQLQMILN